MTITNTRTTKRYCADSGKWCEFANLQGFCTLTACCQRVVYAAETIYTDSPMIEYAPVRHGRWITDPNGGLDMFCSECGGRTLYDTNGMFGDGIMTKYCPNCGARMDGGIDGETD